MFARLKSFLVFAFLGGSCVYSGGTGACTSLTYEAAAPVDCATFASAPKLEGWVNLEKCEALPILGAYSSLKRRGSSGDGSITQVALPLRPLGSTGEATLLLVSDTDARISRAASARNAASGDLAEALRALGGYELSFQGRVLGLRGSEHSDLTREMGQGVSPSAILIEEAEPGRPGLLWPIAKLVLGFLFLMVALASLVPERAEAAGPGEAAPQPEPPASA